MEKTTAALYRYLSLAFFLVIAFLAVLIYFVTYIHQNSTSANPAIFWTVEHHRLITVTLILLSVSIGYLLSSAISRQLMRTERKSQKLLEILSLFLYAEEKVIINHLVQQSGISNQAEISRLPGMNRVKAFRTLKKMQEKNLITIIPNGKGRNVQLNDSITSLLLKRDSVHP